MGSKLLTRTDTPPSSTSQLESVVVAVALDHLVPPRYLVPLANIPSLDNGVAILEAIRDLGRKFDVVTVRLKAVDSNNIARLSNCMLVDASSELAMLRNVDTNQPIEGFPQTPRDIAGLTGPVINSILRALGADDRGGIDARRKRLRVQIGMKADPI
ncbi:hypothetical protein V494_00161 [Pseudogymnoascus sp. VKM F-4513 (FW-928)]|nr:hypothetical protein V494_00161 [Pseudogymnoascus sp. VKM F-4513 (FW-928)]